MKSRCTNMIIYKAIGKFTCSVLICLSLLAAMVTILPAKVYAAGNIGIKTFRTSEMQDEYLEFTIDGDIMHINGRLSDPSYSSIEVLAGHNDPTEYKRFDLTEDSFYEHKATIETCIFGEPTVITIGDWACIEKDENGYFNSDLQLTVGEKDKADVTVTKQRYGSSTSDYVIYEDGLQIKKDTEFGYYFVKSPVYDNNIVRHNTRKSPEDHLNSDISDNIKIKSDEIVSGAASDYEKVRKIHDWVVENIYYNWDYYLGESENVVYSAEEVLKSKTSVCEGYANLTKALIQAQNIPCVKVHGFALGVSTDGVWTDEILNSDRTNHAWNEAYVNGRWIIIDTTWDSANTMENGEFNYEGSRGYRYFDSTEEFFALDHRVLKYENTGNQNFPAEWATVEIAEAIENELIPYYMFSDYESNISRVDFCELICHVLEKISGKDIEQYVKEKNAVVNNKFTDIDNNMVNFANALNIIYGKSENLFAPYDDLTREEAAVMLRRMYTLFGDNANVQSPLNTYSDKAEFSDWAIDGINFVTVKGIMNGVENERFSPQENYTRQQAYITVLRFFNSVLSDKN